ncbi:hypothetical protein CY34DRAFT_269162 [Suillus luteus UH-Slu-Lm8-n1]|uniref:Uncharacterized protein n=1 Tax=Suillus luteus UH-Slu-Lm8-n1 TaxID=930992 RepID=A0A0D0AFI4_9AGAM|nr:hypothetical protein CY34DRAFT_269162 [Suillus luteus UH-Slu-Lm8-n1]
MCRVNDFTEYCKSTVLSINAYNLQIRVYYITVNSSISRLTTAPACMPGTNSRSPSRQWVERSLALSIQIFYTCDQGSAPQLFKHGPMTNTIHFILTRPILIAVRPGPRCGKQRPEPGLSYITPVLVLVPT